MRYGIAACHHNQVDGEAILHFTLNALSEIVDRLGARESLQQKLCELAARGNDDAGIDPQSKAVALQERIGELGRKMDVVKKNAIELADPELRAGAEKLFSALRSQIGELKRELLQIENQKSVGDDPKSEVGKAMALFDDLRQLATDVLARQQMPGLFDRLGVKIGLYFTDGTKGSRHVRQLAGGVLAMGNTEFTVGDKSNLKLQASTPLHDMDLAARLGLLPALAAASDMSSGEDFSCTKVNRGERI